MLIDNDMQRMMDDRKSAIEKRFAEKFEEIAINDRTCFVLDNNSIIAVHAFYARVALVIEYADNYCEALLNRFEDGDLFHIEDMDEETMFRSMIREINQQ